MKQLMNAFIICFLFVANATCHAVTTKPLIIAYRLDSEPIQFRNENGKADGILIDYWRLWSQKSGVPVRFVGGTNTETQAMIKDGSADINAGLFPNERRSGFMDFSIPILNSPYYIYYDKNTIELSSNKDLHDVRVGVTQGSFHDDYLAKNFPAAVRIQFDGYRALFEAAERGDIQAFLTQPLYLSRHSDFLKPTRHYQATAQPLYVRPYRAGVAKGRTDLLNIINQNLLAITDQDRANITNRWLGLDWVQISQKKPNITEKEREWLKLHDEIRLGVDPNWPPFEYIDEDGSYKGLGADFVALINEELQINMQPLKQKLDWQQIIKSAREKEIDVLPAVSPTSERRKYLNFTKPYLTYPYVIFAHQDTLFVTGLEDLKGKTVAVESGYATEDLLKLYHSDIRLKTFKNTSEALFALSRKEVDAFFSNLSAAAWVIDKTGIADVKIAAPTPYNFEQTMAVRKDWPELLTILNKAIDNITPKQRQIIKNRWFKVKFVHETDTSKLWLVASEVAGVAFILILFILLRNRWLQAEINRRRQAEKELEITKDNIITAAQEQFKNLIEGSIQGVWVHVNWRLLFVNGAAVEIFGYDSAEEMLALPSIEPCIAPHERARLRGYRKARLSGGVDSAPIYYEFDGLRKDGSMVTLENIVRVVEWNGQRALQSTLVDITERKKIEKQLVEEKLLADSIIDSLPGSFFVCDHEGHLLRLNRNVEINHNLSEKSLEQVRAIDLIAPYDKEKVEKSWHTLMKKPSVTGEVDILSPTGEAVPHLVSAVRTVIGAHTRIIGVAFDISERKKISDALKRSEEQFRNLVEGSLQGIVVIRDGKALFSNQAMADILGFRSSDDIINQQSVVPLVAPYDQAKVLRVVQAWFDAAPAPEKIEFDAIRVNGEIITLENRGQRVKWAGKYAVQCAYVDVTQRAQAERDLKRAYENLEQKVAERTQELADANNQLQELDRLKSMFIASMSHELRTPLNSIIGFSSIILQGLSGDLNEEQHDQLQRVHNSGKHLLALITEVIDISKIEAGRVNVVIKDVMLIDVINEAKETLKHDIESQKLVLNINLDEDLKLRTDRKRLYQCILNLMSNAIKYTEHGHVDIRAQVANSYIAIEVEDTGIGISEQDQTNLFKPFERIESHLKIIRGGTGLGLYLVHKMAVELLGGGVTVSSVTDKGSCFTLKVAKSLSKDQVINNHESEKNVENNVLIENTEPMEYLSLQDNKMSGELSQNRKLSIISSMSHDLRTPLNAITGFSGILLQDMSGPLNEQQRDQILRIYKASRRLLSNMDSVMSLANINDNKMYSVLSHFNLSEIINEVLDSISDLFDEKDFFIETKLSGEAELYTDREKLKQSLIYLIDSAIRCTKPSQIKLDISTTKQILNLRISGSRQHTHQDSQQAVEDAYDLTSKKLIKNLNKGRIELGLYLSQHMVAQVLGGELFIAELDDGVTDITLRVPTYLNMEESA